jgi:hypothetical protein
MDGRVGKQPRVASAGKCRVPILDDFAVALHDLAIGELADSARIPTLLTQACASVLYVDGASLSLLSETVRMPMGASSPDADAAERLQFTLGDGPCMEVYRTRTAERFTRSQLAARWPVYAIELAGTTPFRSCASFPLDLGGGLLAALDIYLESDDAPPDAMMGDATEICDEITSALLLTTVGAPADAGPDWLRAESMTARANLWIAIALLGVHSPLQSDDLIAALRAYALGRETTLDDVTEAIATLALDPRHILG